jgi:hypothetical protein
MEINVEALGPVGHEIASRARNGEPIVLKENGEPPLTLTSVAASARPSTDWASLRERLERLPWDDVNAVDEVRRQRGQ